jgi:hypothetical protein
VPHKHEYSAKPAPVKGRSAKSDTKLAPSRQAKKAINRRKRIGDRPIDVGHVARTVSKKPAFAPEVSLIEKQRELAVQLLYAIKPTRHSRRAVIPALKGLNGLFEGAAIDAYLKWARTKKSDTAYSLGLWNSREPLLPEQALGTLRAIAGLDAATKRTSDIPDWFKSLPAYRELLGKRRRKENNIERLLNYLVVRADIVCRDNPELNGKIPLTAQMVADLLKCSVSKAQKYLDLLQQLGFIFCAEKTVFKIKDHETDDNQRASHWGVMWKPFMGYVFEKSFATWEKDGNFPVAKHGVAFIEKLVPLALDSEGAPLVPLRLKGRTVEVLRGCGVTQSSEAVGSQDGEQGRCGLEGGDLFPAKPSSTPGTDEAVDGDPVHNPHATIMHTDASRSDDAGATTETHLPAHTFTDAEWDAAFAVTLTHEDHVNAEIARRTNNPSVYDGIYGRNGDERPAHVIAARLDNLRRSIEAEWKFNSMLTQRLHNISTDQFEYRRAS